MTESTRTVETKHDRFDTVILRYDTALPSRKAEHRPQRHDASPGRDRGR